MALKDTRWQRDLSSKKLREEIDEYKEIKKNKPDADIKTTSSMSLCT